MNLNQTYDKLESKLYLLDADLANRASEQITGLSLAQIVFFPNPSL